MMDKKITLRLAGTSGHRLVVAEGEVGKPGSNVEPTTIARLDSKPAT
jgi:hypothetical protein